MYVFVSGLGLIWFGRRLIDAPKGVWGFYTKGGVLGTFLLSFSIFAYIGYWGWQVWRVKQRGK